MALEVDLDGRTAIVTGASSGIGRGIAQTLARAGASVSVADVREEPKGGGVPTVETIRSDGGRSAFIECDVADRGDVDRLVDGTIDAFGDLDILVNNAGISHDGTLETTDEDTWAAVMEVNLTGVFRCSKAALPHLRGSEAPRIVNIASQLGLVGRQRRPAYCASKGGVVNLTRQLAVEYATIPILVNAVCPGVVRTPLTEDSLETPDERAFLEDRTPLPYFGEPEDIGGVVAFLSSDHARFITGASVVVDGGYLAW